MNTSPAADTGNSSVFSASRDAATPTLTLPAGLHYDARLKMDGLDFLARLPNEAIPLAFLDPQYRGILDKLAYGNEGVNRGRARAALQQMDETTIVAFVQAIDRVLAASGHLSCGWTSFTFAAVSRPGWRRRA